MAGLIAMREREGALLAADLAERIGRIEAFRSAAAARARWWWRSTASG